ncbi:MATE family efflux transporter [Blautia sp. An249]|uniref:MATE family efflux transporter n=1 Tax=Blautia sp. An249 TaxID=1965603 RepID=UPI000B3AD4A5|nr:MATE family efflux transporter [Blautia sp. An249]OUO78108.1 MATE family efflux transporter [Blautia sp. An249]
MEATENRMGTKPLFPLLVSMALPPMVSMLIQSLYNIVDSIFVARLSEQALAAVSLVFPLQNLSLAFSVGMGVGLNSCIARRLGAKQQKKAQEAVNHGFLLAGLQGLLFVFIGLFLSRPFLSLFTKDSATLDMAVSYSRIVICFTFGSHIHIAAEKIFQSVGQMVIPMIMQMVGAIVNIILDPVFIFGMFGVPKFGVRGAAIATIIGQMAACLLSILFLYGSKNAIKPSWKGFRFNGKTIGDIYQVGIPSGILVALPSALVGILNGILSYSETAVAVLGLYYKMQSFVYMPANGMIQGLRPIAAYNYGAGYGARLRKVVRICVKMIGVIMAAGTVLFVGFPELIMQLFGAQEEMMKMGSMALRIIGTGFVFSAFSLTYSGTFEALGKGGYSLIISLLRQFLVIVPLAILLPAVWGINGVWAAFPVAEILAAVVSVCLWRKTRKTVFA